MPLPPLHELDFAFDYPLRSPLPASVQRCVTSVEVVSGRWDWGQLLEPGTQLPWPTCGVQETLRVNQFLELVERLPGQRWQLDGLTISVTTEHVRCQGPTRGTRGTRTHTHTHTQLQR